MHVLLQRPPRKWLVQQHITLQITTQSSQPQKWLISVALSLVYRISCIFIHKYKQMNYLIIYIFSMHDYGIFLALVVSHPHLKNIKNEIFNVHWALMKKWTIDNKCIVITNTSIYLHRFYHMCSHDSMHHSSHSTCSRHQKMLVSDLQENYWRSQTLWSRTQRTSK